MPRRPRRATGLLLAGLLALAQPATAAEPMLLEQGWSDAERDTFWWSPQGSRILPHAWFLALERESEGDFSAAEHLAGFGFLAAPGQPDRLPIGFSREPGRGGEAWLGLTCAACHTGVVRHAGRAVLIEGGAGEVDVQRFDAALAAALAATAADDARFARFAARLGTAPGAEAALRERLRAVSATRSAHTAMNTPPHPYGPGRVDALGIIMNAITATALAQPDNARPPDAPVSLPSLWGTSDFSRVQYNASIANAGAGTLLRNTGQVLGVYGEIDLARPGPRGAYESSVSLEGLEALETLVGKLAPPAWPEAVLPPIDKARAGAGAAVFASACAACHQADTRTAQGLRRLVSVPLEQVGTDPRAARNFMTRVVSTGVLEGRPVAVFGGPVFGARAPAAVVMGHASTGVVSNLPPQALGPQLQLFRAASAGDPVRPDGYKAIPLDGIWATAPYLHNGAVANLHELLTPAAQRAARFTLSGRDFDPVAVGLPADVAGAGFVLDTRLPGNAATGHEHGTALPEEEKLQLIEYLKTL